jgi:hypothetical protein
MIRSVLIKPDQSPELEAAMTCDRVVEIDEAGRTSLCDQQFVITEDMIERVI